MQTPAQEPGITRTVFYRDDLAAPRCELVQAHADLVSGIAAPKHTHPGEEIIYVIEGELEYRIEDEPPLTLTAGEVLFIPAGAIHSVKNIGSGNAAELGTYVVEKGKPLVVPAP